MLFTVELEGAVGPYRLQKDRSWRKIGDSIRLTESDFTSASTSEVIARSPCGGTLTLGGATYDVEPGTWPSKHDALHYRSLVFRRKFPKEPSRDQLRKVIAAGDDSVCNVLILNVRGDFELRQPPEFNTLANDPSVVVRHESFAAGNDYVGVSASRHDALIDEHFESSLEAWVEHLKSHRAGEYCDAPATMPVDAIRRELRAVERQWKPDY